MSVCVAFNLSDGVVMAVDSATTMFDGPGSISKVFLDADKIFRLGESRVDVATYGVAALHGRTIGSFIRQFVVDSANRDIDKIPVAELVERLRAFMFEHYRAFLEKIHSKPLADIDPSMKGLLGLVVGGFSPEAFQSELWEIVVPLHDKIGSAKLRQAAGVYGLTWFASAAPITRYLKGFDAVLSVKLRQVFEKILGRQLTQDEQQEFKTALDDAEYQIKIDGMPIQSGIDCARFLVEFVLNHYRFAETHPIVGGRAKIGVVAYDHSAFRILD